MRRLAVVLRVDVAAAGQDERVEAVECLVGAAERRRERTHLGAGTRQRLLVVGDSRTGRESDQGHHILAGTTMPIRSSAAVSCARTYAMPAARQARTSGRSSLRIGDL